MSVIFILTNLDFAWMDRLPELGFHISVIPEPVPDAILIYGYFHHGSTFLEASCNFSSYFSMIMILLYFQVPKTDTFSNGSHINPVVITEVKLWF